MILAECLEERVRYLSHVIGTRVAGSEEEHRAAEYIRGEFLQSTPHVSVEHFPAHHLLGKVECFEVFINGKWEAFPALPLNCTPTTHGELVTADLVYFDPHVDYQRTDLSYLRGKAVVHYGTSSPDDESYERLLGAEPAFVMMTHTNYTNDVPIHDSMLPAQVQRYGAIPMLSVAFFDIWKWFTGKAERARVRISGENEIGRSQNVIAEIPGTDEDAGCIYLGGHMDSVLASPGADDNAIGCAIIMEMAKELSKKPHRNTIRFCAFGTEEQLSVGSAMYVRAHREEIEKRGRFMLNFDSCASFLGWNRFVMNAEPELRKEIRSFYNGRDIYYVEQRNPDPCNDLFPFTVLGVPGFTILRSNCESGKFFHHRYDNDLQVMSFDIAAQLANAGVEWVTRLADRDLSSFYKTDKGNEAVVQKMWESDFGGFG